VRGVATIAVVCSFGGRPRRAGGGAITGAGPVCGWSRSTETRWRCPPTITSKVFAPASATEDGPAYGGVSGGSVPPRLMYTHFARWSSSLGACGGWGMELVGIETGPGSTCSKKSTAGGSAASTNSPGRTRGAPYTSSAEDMALPSLGVVHMPSSTQGRCAGHSWLANLVFRPSLSWQ
jgi:hypothetical protein